MAETAEVNVNIEPTEEVKVKIESTDETHQDASLTTSNTNGKESVRNEVQAEEPKATNDIDANIIRQIEYYFGDFNIPRDKFLKEQITLDDGWIPVSTMLKFARLSQITNSPQVIVNALKKSTSGLMEISPKGDKIRRVKPIPEETEEWLSEVKARTVYCKGFPKEAMNIDKLLDFFKQFQTVVNIKMRYYTSNKDQSRHFKGTANVTFSKREEAEKFMTLEAVKYNDYSLQRQWSVEWEKEKAEEHEARRLRKEKNGGDKNGQNENTDENGNGKEAEKEKSIVLPRGAILKLVNLSSDVDRDEIKSAFNSYPADIAYVEITPENTAFVRLRGENDAKLVLEKLVDQKISIGDASVGVSVLDGDEETEYIKKAEEHLNNRAQSFRGNRGRGGGRGRGRGGRGGRGGYRGHKRSGSPSGSRGSKQKQSRDD